MWLLHWLNAIVIICGSVIVSICFFCSGVFAAMKAFRSSVTQLSMVAYLSPWAIEFRRSLPTASNVQSSSVISSTNNPFR